MLLTSQAVASNLPTNLAMRVADMFLLKVQADVAVVEEGEVSINLLWLQRESPLRMQLDDRRSRAPPGTSLYLMRAHSGCY